MLRRDLVISTQYLALVVRSTYEYNLQSTEYSVVHAST